MSTTVNEQPPNKRYKSNTTKSTDETPSNLYKPEPIQPEWLELPPELVVKDGIDPIGDSVSWDKYSPYRLDRHLPLVPPEESPIFSSESPALCFQVNGVCGRARACTLHFPNGGPPVPTPRFMPVGTKGTLKGVLPLEIDDMKCPIILANTYHLAIQPGTDLIDEVFGGLPKFMGSTTTNDSKQPQKRLFNLLTDSGGFQMVSLAALSQVTEKGVLFESPYTGKPMLLQPEDSIKCQNEIGADIIMQLDDVVSSVATDDERFRIATFRTLRWYDRCVKAHKFPDRQNLYPIMQGHLDVSPGGMRELCLAGFRHRDRQRKIPGFAIGGLAGGESKDEFWRVVDHACKNLPDDRPRYLMGVGYPLDLVVCTALGVDQYDCVYPTRTARFGVALVDEGQMKLKLHEFVHDDRPILNGCPCQACSRGVSRRRLHSLLKSNNSMGVQLVTHHNVTYMMSLVTRMRKAIIKQAYPDFVRKFIRRQFPKTEDIPVWVTEALLAAGISIKQNY